MWFGSRNDSLSPLNLFVSKGSIYCIGGCIVLSIGIVLRWCDAVVTFARKPTAFNESYLFVSTWSLVGVNIFLFGTIVLSKVNVRLRLLLWIYALMREVLDTFVGNHFFVTLFSFDEYTFLRLLCHLLSVLWFIS